VFVIKGKSEICIITGNITITFGSLQKEHYQKLKVLDYYHK